jgi:hypothetical protein
VKAVKEEVVCTGRAYVVGGHGAEMSESGYRISVVAMVWVFMEIDRIRGPNTEERLNRVLRKLI